MALSAAQVLEIRSATGSDTNGGGFKAGASGTDWSQQDTPQYSVTDGVTAGTTTITSATANFGTDVVGNLIYVQGGTGSVVAGWYEITVRNSATSITVDRSTGLTAGTGVTLHIGGAFATLGAAFAIHIIGNTLWAKGSFSPTGTVLTLANTTALFGYTTSRGDNGQIAVDATGMTAANNTFAMGASSTIGNVAVSNSKAISILGAGNSTAFNCKASAGAGAGFSTITQVASCEASGCAGAGFTSCGTLCFCFAHGCTGASGNGFNACSSMSFCVAAANSQTGLINSATEVGFFCCISYGNGAIGFSGFGAGGPVFVNCVSYGNTTFGYQWGGTSPNLHGYMRNCFAGSNTSGATTNSVTLLDGTPTNLSAQPFVDPTVTFDFTPNTAAGGGALLRNGGFDFVAGCLNAGFLDGGAIRHQDPAGVSIPAPPIIGRGYSLVG